MPRRMYLTVWYDDFRTKSSGDVFSSEGQWYFMVNKQRFPTKGTFLLSKNEPFEFSDRNKPLLYSAMINHTKAAFKLRIKVCEQDVLFDDTFIRRTLEVPLESSDKVVEIASKDNRQVLKLRICVLEKPQW